jgi:3-phenylpropionate/cinnamic acid dioxygenase small subunit
MHSPLGVGAAMISEVGQLLYREAHLLDCGEFRAWLELLAPDLRYWAPVRSDVPRNQEKENELCRLLLFDETKASLELRIGRLETGLAWVETPPSRTRRFVTNIAIDGESAGLVLVRSNFMLFRSRSYTDETLLVGCREDKWSRSDKWLLRERKILIDHCAVENMSLLL